MLPRLPICCSPDAFKLLSNQLSSINSPDALLQGVLEEKVELALSELPEKQRTALLLCRQDELSYEEIAEVLECSLSATKSLIHRGRETLKEKLKPYLKTGVWSES